MCKAKSDGGRRCNGCVRRGITDRLTGAAERVNARLQELSTMSETCPTEETPSRRRRRFRDLVAQAWGALRKKRDARAELRELEQGDVDVATVARVETAESRLQAAEDQVVIEEAALAIDGESIFGRRSELMRALVPVEREQEALVVRLAAARARMRPVDEQPGPQGFPTERRQAVNGALRDLDRVNARAKALVVSWSGTPKVAEQELRVTDARAELAAATTAYEASLESESPAVVSAAA